MTKPLYNVYDVMAILDVSRAMAYRIIKELNTELENKGFWVVKGKVNSDYFRERLNLVSENYSISDPEEIKRQLEKKEQERKGIC